MRWGYQARACRYAVKPSSAKAANERLAALLAATHPMWLTISGGGGLALILWLLMFKPF